MIVIVKRTLIVQRVVLNVKGYLHTKGKYARNSVLKILTGIQIARLDTFAYPPTIFVFRQHNEVVSARTGIIFLYYYKKMNYMTCTYVCAIMTIVACSPPDNVNEKFPMPDGFLKVMVAPFADCWFDR